VRHLRHLPGARGPRPAGPGVRSPLQPHRPVSRQTVNRMTSDTPNVSLRDATPEDDEFLVRVYASVREQELALTGWSAAQRDAFVRMQFGAQQQHYRTHYPTGVHQIILLDGQPVGRLYWA